jgi:hypothetical protein
MRAPCDEIRAAFEPRFGELRIVRFDQKRRRDRLEPMRYARLTFLLAVLCCADASAQFVHLVSLAVSGDSATAPQVERCLRRELRRLRSAVQIRRQGSFYAINATVALTESENAYGGRVAISFTVSVGFDELLSIREVGRHEDLRALCSHLISRFSGEILIPAEAAILDSI